MKLSSPRRLVVALAVALLTARSAGSQTSYHVEHERSYLLAVVGVAGVLSSLAHEHAVLATEGDAEICFSPEDVERSHVRFTVPTDSLRIDTPRARELAGLDPSWPNDKTRADLQEKMLSERFLAAERYDTMSFTSRKVSGSADELWLEGDFTLRGRTNRVAFPVQVTRGDDGLHLRGGLTVKQTDFGMEPESIAGVVKVADAVEVRFEILARPDGEGC